LPCGSNGRGPKTHKNVRSGEFRARSAGGVRHTRRYCTSRAEFTTTNPCVGLKTTPIRSARRFWVGQLLGWGGGRGAPQRPCPAPARGPGCSAGGAAIQASSSRRTCIPTRRRRKRGPTQRHRQLWTDISPRGQATAVRGGALFRGPGETNPPGHSSHRHHEYCLLPPLLVLVLLQVAHRSARVGCGRVNELQGGERTRLAVYQR